MVVLISVPDPFEPAAQVLLQFRHRYIHKRSVHPSAWPRALGAHHVKCVFSLDGSDPYPRTRGHCVHDMHHPVRVDSRILTMMRYCPHACCIAKCVSLCGFPNPHNDAILPLFGAVELARMLAVFRKWGSVYRCLLLSVHCCFVIYCVHGSCGFRQARRRSRRRFESACFDWFDPVGCDPGVLCSKLLTACTTWTP